jgi:hypothetical protein
MPRSLLIARLERFSLLEPAQQTVQSLQLDNFLRRSVSYPFAFYSLKTEIVNYVDILSQR